MMRFRYLAIVFIALVSVIALSQPLLLHAAGSCPASGCLNNSITRFPEVYLQPGLASVIAILSFIAGILSVIFLILGGIRYTTSSGDPARVNGARQTITYAVIGLTISIIAPLIVGFVVARGPN